MKSGFSLPAVFLIAGLSAIAGYHFQANGTTVKAAVLEVNEPSSPQQTIRHLDRLPVMHLDQQSEEKHPWGSIRWLMTSKIDADAGQSFGIVRIEAGQQNTMHLHPNCEELFYVLSGSGESVVADQKVVLHPGYLIRIPAHTFHQATATGKEPLIAVVSYNSPDKQNINFPAAGH